MVSKRLMKIAIIISNTNDPKTGTATVSLNLAKKFTLSGHFCKLIFREDLFKDYGVTLGQLLFAFVLPKFKVLLLALLLSCPGEVTVRVAAELVALPAELVTTTLKVEPLSEVAVAGVV